jgi:site-specific DNA recombinase
MRREWRVTEAAWLKSEIAAADADDLAARLVAKIAPRDAAPPLLAAARAVTKSLLLWEDIGSLDVDWAVIDADPSAELNLRQTLARRRRWASDTTIGRLIQDETAKGVHRANYTSTTDNTRGWNLKPESEWVWTEVPALISVELWDSCNAVMARRKQGARPSRTAAHLFAGFAYCACGTKMYMWSNSPKYRCTGCNNKIPTEDLEAVYREQLRQFLLSPEEIDAHAAAAQELMGEKARLIEAAEAELKRIEAEDENVFQLYLGHELTKEDFGRRHKPLSARRDQLENEIPRLQAELDVLRISSLSYQENLSEAQDLATRWSDLSFTEKRQIIESITERIVIGREEVEIHLLQVEPVGISADKATKQQGFCAATSWTFAG